VDALLVSYYRSPNFRNLRPITQSQRRRILEKFRSNYGDLPVNALRRENVNNILAAKADKTPAAANTLHKVLRLILNYTITIDMISVNPAVGMRMYLSHGDGYHAWTEEEIAQFEAAHPIGTKARLALALLLHTGQRVSDVARMGWQHVTGDVIAIKQQKTGTALKIPLHPELRAMLVALPKTNLTFILSERGAPFAAKNFSDWFKRQCRIAGLHHCSAHGLRKACATRLANAGCSVSQIAAITGHKSLDEVAHYTRAADQERLARAALRIVGSEGERTSANLDPPFVQPIGKSL
jgi:integrase